MRTMLVTAILLIAIGIIGLFVLNTYIFLPRDPTAVGPQGRDPRDFRSPQERQRTDGFTNNAEQIFFTGISNRDRITTTGGPTWFRMHGGGCATCHGPDGRGGRVVMMGSFTAPNITYETLTSEERAVGTYTDELIIRAIRQGIRVDDERLNQNMPRWNMSDRDVNELIDYLKVLD